MPLSSLKFSIKLSQNRWWWIALSLGLTIGLFVASSLAWNWYAERQANAARQSSLDLLWIEQSITNKLETHQSILQNWGDDIRLGNNQSQVEFLRRIDNLLKENRAILAIDYLSNDGQRLLGLPIYDQRPSRLPPLNDPLIEEAIGNARSLKSASYSKVIEQFAPLWALVVPLFNEGKYSGSIIVTYDLDKLLNQEIPWWFVQRYNLNLVDKNNKQLSPSDAGLVEHQGQINRLDFGGGHTGLSLNTSVREKTFTDRLLPSLTIAVIVFGLMITWLLQLLRRWIQERRRARQALRERDELLQHNARLSSLAEFASGIAHELNQPLAAIANYSAAVEALMQSQSPQTEKIQSAIIKMGEESRRAGKIMHSMRSFIHKHSAAFEPRQLEQLAQDAIELVTPLARRHGVHIELVTPHESMPIDCDAEMLKQVFFNILRNAIEALATKSNENNPYILCELAISDSYYTIAIADNGPGLAEPDKLFQAFYTTKSDGMGLGLAICRTVIENHGGRITASNAGFASSSLVSDMKHHPFIEAMTGAHFNIRLPRNSPNVVDIHPHSKEEDHEHHH